MSRIRTAAVAAALATALLTVGTAGATSAAAATRGAVQPQTVTGDVIPNGADGSQHTLMCPPEESVLSGGYALTAQPGHTLAPLPADLLESRPNADASGWIVSVRKFQQSEDHKRYEPANLTLYVACTQGENTPGG
ncbi:hypothetical protein P3T36_000075 [Kitasatospora sp. MAP12-15]|uniref:hypothetical protein n=1 Tax=unclassified Kitasatospora TaxID=2633591 RepID=UPI0024730FE5|nr:hypothetical protein [Kitasatospora sp. MAP12-44]MDH6109303.1 hypothetical protein [Kitasatospora sp. MAP12-44]